MLVFQYLFKAVCKGGGRKYKEDKERVLILIYRSSPYIFAQETAGFENEYQFLKEEAFIAVYGRKKKPESF